MNLEDRSITTSAILTLIPILCFPALFSSLRLLFFAPFLVILYYKKSYSFCLWAALLCGLLLDLLTSSMRIGLYAMSYCLTTGFLYGQRRNFFADSISTLPIMTFLFSISATLIQLIFVYVFEQNITFSKTWLLTDLVYMPAADALYGFSIFVLPFLLFGKQQRRGKDYFF